MGCPAPLGAQKAAATGMWGSAVRQGSGQPHWGPHTAGACPEPWHLGHLSAWVKVARGWPALALPPRACAWLSAKPQIIFNASGFVSDAAQGWSLIKGKADSELIKLFPAAAAREPGLETPAYLESSGCGFPCRFSRHPPSACGQRHPAAPGAAPLGLTMSSTPGVSVPASCRQTRSWAQRWEQQSGVGRGKRFLLGTLCHASHQAQPHAKNCARVWAPAPEPAGSAAPSLLLPSTWSWGGSAVQSLLESWLLPSAQLGRNLLPPVFYLE